MNHALQESSTVRRPQFFAPEIAGTSRPVRQAGGSVTRYSFHWDASSAVPLVLSAGVSHELRVYQSYRQIADHDSESTSGGTASLVVVLGQGLDFEELMPRVATPHRNEAAIALLESWLAAPDRGEDDQQLGGFMEAIDEDRLSTRKLFP